MPRIKTEIVLGKFQDNLSFNSVNMEESFFHIDRQIMIKGVIQPMYILVGNSIALYLTYNEYALSTAIYL